MTRQNGAIRIFLYNWPVYVGTWSVAFLLLFCLPVLRGRSDWAIALLASIAVFWSIVSLAVSHYIYDQSRLVRGAWIPPLLSLDAREWVVVHAGLDAELDVDAVLPDRCIARLDIFDERFMHAPSIRRARLRTSPAHPSSRCSPTSLALPGDACDTIVVAFTAHEIRDRDARERFFAELGRCLRPGGRALLVEHLRDTANFLAFGPGCLHFLARAEWLRLAAHARLAVADERRITPWVMALTLEKRA